MKDKYTVEKNAEGKWWVVDPEGKVVATFTTKWEAEDFAYEMNERSK
jgi:hypothetical protein